MVLRRLFRMHLAEFLPRIEQIHRQRRNIDGRRQWTPLIILFALVLFAVGSVLLNKAKEICCHACRLDNAARVALVILRIEHRCVKPCHAANLCLVVKGQKTVDHLARGHTSADDLTFFGKHNVTCRRGQPIGGRAVVCIYLDRHDNAVAVGVGLVKYLAEIIDIDDLKRESERVRGILDFLHEKFAVAGELRDDETLDTEPVEPSRQRACLAAAPLFKRFLDLCV